MRAGASPACIASSASPRRALSTEAALSIRCRSAWISAGVKVRVRVRVRIRAGVGEAGDLARVRATARVRVRVCEARDLEDGLAPRELGDGSTGREGDPCLAHLALLDPHLVGGGARVRVYYLGSRG